MKSAPTAATPRTMFAKIWASHRIVERETADAAARRPAPDQDGSAPAFEMLRQRRLAVRSPRARSTPDHYVPTDSRDLAT
jgi:3-isopropylmalate/(R)-2-methylmalate dehydratase large subunit